MPLRDHFRPAVGKRRSWEGLQGGWPMMIVLGLSKILPDRHVAEPRVHLGSDADEYEVRVYDAEQDQRLVAAIEIISPSNKDRPESRSQFVAKCASLLRQHVSVILIDLVSIRASNRYAELLELIDQHDPALGDDPSSIYTAACRWSRRGTKDWLEAWARPLEVGKALPVLPLWLSDELAIPLDLETSYEQTCGYLRID